ncbi:MAG: PIG-L family deacetylase [Candidatus Glassbacteria bacterium]|nr:PIG-L family deacetylase [Candidatus Glassbacteria bacterium]
MKFLYVFPHPDDESFGPGPGINSQLRDGHEVYLLTLTRGEATSIRHKLGLDKQQMGEVRYREMQCVSQVYGLTGMTVLNLPDGGLKELDPREIEHAVEKHVREIEPQILITYPAHGISGFHDHLIAHAVVKRVFCQLREDGADYLRRLAFFTVDEQTAKNNRGAIRLNHSTAAEIDCRFVVDDQDLNAFNRALDCYGTYREVVEKSKVRESVSREICYEIFGEEHDPPLEDPVEF